MIFIKIVIVLFGAYIFFVFTSILLNWIRSKYIKLKSKENENLHMVNQAGEEVLGHKGLGLITQRVGADLWLSALQGRRVRSGSRLPASTGGRFRRWCCRCS